MNFLLSPCVILMNPKQLTIVKLKNVEEGGIIMFNDMTNIEILKLLAPVIIINFSLAIFCLYKLSKDKVKYLPKWAWVIVILFVSMLGSISYLILGRERD